jgi:hypothetical protein
LEPLPIVGNFFIAPIRDEVGGIITF